MKNISPKTKIPVHVSRIRGKSRLRYSFPSTGSSPSSNEKNVDSDVLFKSSPSYILADIAVNQPHGSLLQQHNVSNSPRSIIRKISMSDDSEEMTASSV